VIGQWALVAVEIGIPALLLWLILRNLRSD